VGKIGHILYQAEQTKVFINNIVTVASVVTAIILYIARIRSYICGENMAKYQSRFGECEMYINNEEMERLR
jgi:hypothetical protein